MIKFHCTNCNKKIAVLEQYAGKRGTCPRCKSVQSVPSQSSVQVIDEQGNKSQIKTDNANTGNMPELRIAEPTKSCPFCGEIILEIAKKCKHCGEFLAGARCEVIDSPSSFPEVRKGCWYYFRNTVYTLGVLVGLLVFYVSFFDTNPENGSNKLDSGDKSSESTPSWQSLSRENASEIFAKSQEIGFIKKTDDFSSVWVERASWNAINSDEKEQFMYNWAIYFAYKENSKDLWIEVYDYQSGVKLAKYGPMGIEYY